MINEIKKIDKTKMFIPKEKKKIGFWDRILIIFGYGKKRWFVKSTGNNIGFDWKNESMNILVTYKLFNEL